MNEYFYIIFIPDLTIKLKLDHNFCLIQISNTYVPEHYIFYTSYYDGIFRRHKPQVIEQI